MNTDKNMTKKSLHQRQKFKTHHFNQKIANDCIVLLIAANNSTTYSYFPYMAEIITIVIKTIWIGP